MNLFNAVNIRTPLPNRFNAPVNKNVTAQLQFFENFPGHLGVGTGVYSHFTMSVHAVNIPLSISFNNVAILFTGDVAATSHTRNNTALFGLYSLNGSTLSLANSASTTWSYNASLSSWITFQTSATQNISPGAWYFALNVGTGTTGSGRLYINSSIAPGNAIPGGFLMGRMTVSTGAMPASIATSDLDITGSDAIRQPYIILTA